MTDLAGSGAPSPPLVKKFDDLVKSWKTDLAKSKVRARFDAKTCYAAGCTVTLAFSDPIAFQRSAPIITHADGFRTWRGAKFRSAPIPSAAERAVRTTWIMFAD